ncbi:MAG: CPBP family glutamic-type intramembrane protease [Acidobacteriota bacterium]
MSTDPKSDPNFMTLAYPRPVADRSEIPERYRVREEDGLLICTEAPTVRVSVKRGATVSGSALRNAPKGSIFVDGAAEGPPLVDVEGAVINLDHHESCIRAFTLSACEQALVLVIKGFDFQSRDWTVHANEPDLDTLLALWVLLNHRRLQSGPSHVQERMLPLIRLEGAIDVHGLEHRSLCGLPKHLEKEAMEKLDSVRELEVRLKDLGEWSTANWAEYVLDRLGFIDRLVYRASDFRDHTEVEEIARAELADDGLAIACRSEAEIYVVEEALRELYGQRLGIILLEKEAGIYTLRQARVFSRYSLERAYERLNELDPAAGNSASGHRWGGSADIGGSPRGVKTELTAEQILSACRNVSRPLQTGVVARSALGPSAVVAAVVALAVAASQGLAGVTKAPWAGALVGVVLVAMAIGLARNELRGSLAPAGTRWLLGVPVAALAALAGGGWSVVSGPSLSFALVASLALAVAAELLFRGLVFGAVQRSVAGHATWRGASLWIPASLYALMTPAFAVSFADWRPSPFLSEGGSILLGGVLTGVTALFFGGALGWVRRESESVVPAVLLHAALSLALCLL